MLPLPVMGHYDRVRLHQLLESLLDNALKFGAGKPVEVSVSQSSEQASLTVLDHGTGIGPEDRERIFGRFGRAVSAQELWWVRAGLVDRPPPRGSTRRKPPPGEHGWRRRHLHGGAPVESRPRLIGTACTWLILAWGLSFPALVLWRRSRPWALGMGALVHLGIALTLDVGHFSFTVLAFYPLFLPGRRG